MTEEVKNVESLESVIKTPFWTIKKMAIAAISFLAVAGLVAFAIAKMTVKDKVNRRTATVLTANTVPSSGNVTVTPDKNQNVPVHPTPNNPTSNDPKPNDPTQPVKPPEKPSTPLKTPPGSTSNPGPSNTGVIQTQPVKQPDSVEQPDDPPTQVTPSGPVEQPDDPSKQVTQPDPPSKPAKPPQKIPPQEKPQVNRITLLDPGKKQKKPTETEEEEPNPMDPLKEPITFTGPGTQVTGTGSKGSQEISKPGRSEVQRNIPTPVPEIGSFVADERIYFHRNLVSADVKLFHHTGELWSVNPDGTDLKLHFTTSSPIGNVIKMGTEPKLFFIQSGVLMIFNLDESKPTKFLNAEGDAISVEQFDLSRDDKKLALKTNDSETEITVLNIESKAETTHSLDQIDAEEIYTRIQFSSNGETVYTAKNCFDGESDDYSLSTAFGSIKLDGGSHETLKKVASSVKDFLVSPDSKAIYYIDNTRKRVSSLNIEDQSADPVVIGNFKWKTGSSFELHKLSKDGSSIYLISRNPSSYPENIYKIDVKDCALASLLEDGKKFDFEGVLKSIKEDSGLGNEVIYFPRNYKSGKETIGEIWSIKADGTGLQRHLKTDTTGVCISNVVKVKSEEKVFFLYETFLAFVDLKDPERHLKTAASKGATFINPDSKGFNLIEVDGVEMLAYSPDSEKEPRELMLFDIKKEEEVSLMFNGSVDYNIVNRFYCARDGKLCYYTVVGSTKDAVYTTIGSIAPNGSYKILKTIPAKFDNFVVSHSGQYIYYIEGHKNLMSLDISDADSKPVKLHEFAGAEAEIHGWSKNNSTIYIIKKANAGGEPENIYKFDIMTGKMTALLEEGTTFGFDLIDESELEIKSVPKMNKKDFP